MNMVKKVFMVSYIVRDKHTGELIYINKNANTKEFSSGLYVTGRTINRLFTNQDNDWRVDDSIVLIDYDKGMGDFDGLCDSIMVELGRRFCNFYFGDDIVEELLR